MKILMVTTEFPPFPGGIATYTYNMALSALKLNYKVTVIAPNYGKTDINENGIDVVRYNGESYNKKDLFKIMLTIYKQYKNNSYDVIHATDWPSLMAVYLLSFFIKLDYIVTIHGTDIYVLKYGKTFKIINSSKMLQSAKAIIANSDFTKNLLTKEFPKLSNNIYFSYLGVSQDFYNTSNSLNIHKKHSLSQKKIILSVSRIDSRKGHIDCIKALNKLPNNLKDEIIYVIIGKNNNDKYFEEFSQELYTSKVKSYYLGSVDFSDLLAFYENSYLFCLPGKKDATKVEGFGLVYLEAAAKKLPSIAYKLNAVPEVVKDGVTGLLCEADNIELLARNIRHLLENPKQRDEMGNSAYKYSTKFTWENCVKDTYENFNL